MASGWWNGIQFLVLKTIYGSSSLLLLIILLHMSVDALAIRDSATGQALGILIDEKQRVNSAARNISI